MSPVSLFPAHLGNRLTPFSVEELRQMKKHVPALADEARSELASRAQVADPGWLYFHFRVQFEPQGRRYSFAAIRVPGGAIYTTGTGEASTFPSWASLVDWLQQPDKHYVSLIYQLHQEPGAGVDPRG